MRFSRSRCFRAVLQENFGVLIGHNKLVCNKLLGT